VSEFKPFPAQVILISSKSRLDSNSSYYK